MEVEGTKEAFKQMLEVRNIHETLGVDKSTVSNWRKYLNEGKGITTEKMEEMLFKYGSKLTVAPKWNLPINKLQANQLRIGNWVQTDTYQQIGGPKSDRIRQIEPNVLRAVYENKFSVSGIELSDELMKGLGFSSSTIEYDNTFYLSPIHLQKEENRGWFFRLYAGYINKNPIHYLHELQNLYFVIAGRELDINDIALELIKRLRHQLDE